MKNILTLLILLTFFAACEKEKDNLDKVSNAPGPSNVSATFDIEQDNSGLVTIMPTADGVTGFLIMFGDDPLAVPEEYAVNETITHIYEEGTYTVEITAIGISGKTADYEQELNVTFKAPENLVVTIAQDAANPKIVNVSATADYATIMDIYFGDVANEEPVHALPGEEVTHTYDEPGNYEIKVEAKSGGEATTIYTETVIVPEASDPVNLPIDFESFTVNYGFENFGSAVSTVIDNPDASGINTSNRVAQFVKPSGSETWAGSLLIMENPIDFTTNKLFKLKVWSPKAGAIVKLKVENIDNGEIAYEVDATTTVTNQWEELSYDFSGIDLTNEYQKVVFFFDFGNPGDDATYYFDDVKLVLANVPSISKIEDFEGEAPEFTVFGNIAEIEVVTNPDQSGANTTANTAKMIKSSGSETWAGAYFEVDNPLDLDNFSKIKVSTWSPNSGIIIKLKLENSDASITHEVDITNTTANAWEDLVYDFSGAPVADYIRIVIFFDFDNPGDDSEYYFDEIELVNEGGASSFTFEDFEGEAPAFTVFGNIADIEVVTNPDQSGANTTANAAKMTKTSGSETWAGGYFEVDPGVLDLDSYSKIKVSTWSPNSGIIIKLKLENSDASITHEVDIINSTANAWEDLVYDFSDAPAADYIRVVIFFDFDNPGDDSVYYFDEYALTN
ncbi:MAG: PKD domain-containing protein [Bacteroidetes bacterium]|nr:PKD domain-containing protein [Bacteroidota bacterium]